MLKANATFASIGMLAPFIETKPYENRLLELMLDSKKLWNDNFKQKMNFKMSALKKIHHC